MSLERIHVYELVETLDRRGPGRVYRAEVAEAGGPVEPGTEVQFRVVDESEIGGAEVLDTLVQAHGLARTIKSPLVSAPLDFGVIRGDAERRFWSVSRLEKGKTLAQLISEVGTLPDALTEELAKQILEAVDAVHHGGLRAIGLVPSNLLLRPDTSMVLLDPGFGPVFQREALEAGDAESAHCAPPEVHGDPLRLTARADIYAIGAVLYRCVSGLWYDECDHTASDSVEAPPDETQSRRPNDFRHSASIFLSEFVHALLEPDLDLRFESAAEARAILERRRDSQWWYSRHIQQDTRDEEEKPAERIKRDPEPPPIPPPSAPPQADWYAERLSHIDSLGTHTARCVGRDAQLRELLEAVRELGPGRGSVVLVEGGPGVGKTRLLDDLLTRVRDLEAVPLFGGHRRSGIGRPLQAFSEGLTRWIRHSRDVTTNDVAPLLAEATAIAPAFAAFLSGEPLPEGTEALTRESLASAFAAVLKTMSTERSVVFVVEDLQWADPEGLDLFGFLARLSAHMPLLLIGSYRPPTKSTALSALIASTSAQRHTETISLGPLDAEGTAHLLVELIEPDSLASTLAPRLHEATGGVPLHLIESLRLFAANGQLLPTESGRLTGGAEVVAAVPPVSVLDVLAARLSRLGDVERRFLDAAAVQGVAFDADVVRRALRLDDSEFDLALDRLAEAHFVEGRDFAWHFESNELFSAVHDGLGDTELEGLHSATADGFLASRNPDQLPPSQLHGILSYRVAWHYLLARQATRGMLYVAAALGHLRDTWRVGDAERLAHLAIRTIEGESGRVGELLDLLIERADLIGMQGRRVEQRELLDDVLIRSRSVKDTGREARVLLASAKLRLIMGRVKKARTEARETLKLASDSGDARTESKCHALLGSVAFRESRFQEARQHMQKVLDLSRRVRDEEAEAEALTTLGCISQDVGSWDHAEELQRAAMGIYRKSGDLASEADVLTSLGTIAAATEDPAKAEQYFRRALAIHRSLGDGYSEARVLGHLGTLLQESMRLSDARVLHRACLQASREVGARQEEQVALLNLASTEYALGYLDDARNHFGDALRATRDEGARRLAGYALTGLGDVARQNHEFDIARNLFERALAKLKQTDDGAGLAAALLSSGRLELLAGEVERADALLQESVAAAAAASDSHSRALACVYRALLAARGGRRDAVRMFLEKSNAALMHLDGAELAHIEQRFVESLVSRVLGDPESADRKLLAAESLVRELTDRLREQDRTSFVANVSPAREIVAGAASLRARSIPVSAREGDTA